MSKQKLDIITEILGNYQRSGNEYLFKCPYCSHHKKKYSVNLEKGGKCWICDAKTSNLGRIVKRFGSFIQQQEWKELTGQVDITDFEKLLFGNEEKTVEKENKRLEDELKNKSDGLKDIVEEQIDEDISDEELPDQHEVSLPSQTVVNRIVKINKFAFIYFIFQDTS
jgi:hypothetical protein